jgi:hypothetical protein
MLSWYRVFVRSVVTKPTEVETPKSLTRALLPSRVKIGSLSGLFKVFLSSNKVEDENGVRALEMLKSITGVIVNEID